MRAVVLMLLVAVAAAAGATHPDELIEEWNAFKLEHQKSYQDEAEEKYRMKIFAKNRHTVNEHNKRYERGEVTYTMGINKFSDLLHQEFKDMMMTENTKYQGNVKVANIKTVTNKHLENVNIPRNFDWRDKGAVSKVKDQGKCHASYAFAITGQVESQVFINYKKKVLLSEQQIIDCSSGPQFGNKGCQWGCRENVFPYLEANYGAIDTESSYKFEGKLNECRYNYTTRGAITYYGYLVVSPGTDYGIYKYVVDTGPITVVIDASLPDFQQYNGGVYYNKNCSAQNPTLYMLVVGYGTDNATKTDYWILKNSWGTQWGDKGYMKLARNETNMCGISDTPEYLEVGPTFH